MDERMFQTEDEYEYYKRIDGTWFIRKNHKKFLDGWKCIGSIDLSKISKEHIENPELFVCDTLEQLEIGPPEDFSPYFKVGNFPLTIKERPNRYWVNFGKVIKKVYKWI